MEMPRFLDNRVLIDAFHGLSGEFLRQSSYAMLGFHSGPSVYQIDRSCAMNQCLGKVHEVGDGQLPFVERHASREDMLIPQPVSSPY